MPTPPSFNLHTFIIGKLRAATRRCPRFGETRAAARVHVRASYIEEEDGSRWLEATPPPPEEPIRIRVYKRIPGGSNRVMFRCANCKRLFLDHEYLPTSKTGRLKKSAIVVVDHIDPCVDPNVGFVDWNTYITRMFEGPLQVLCNYPGERDGAASCHTVKTRRERGEAAARRAVLRPVTERKVKRSRKDQPVSKSE